MYQIQEIEAQDLAALLAERPERLRLIDVRTPAEFARGVIPEAESLPLHLLPLHVDRVEEDSTIIFYCQSGARSAQACAFLAARGHEKVYNLRGGIIAWAQRGMPIGQASMAM